MLDSETKRRIDTARDILVGKVPDPKSQVEQITIALIYKFMDDMDAKSEELGGTRNFFAGEFARFGWPKLMRSGLGGHEMLNVYAEAIGRMPENPGIPLLFRDIFNNAYLPYRDPETLRAFLKVIDEFTYDHSERLGDAFEYLLSVLGSQGDAGQFRTPRHIIDFIVAVIDPKKNETILDPACGTAGFLISSYKHIVEANTDSDGNSTLTPDERERLTANFQGYDISPDMVRLSLVNMYLHGFQEPHIFEYDTLTSEDRWNEYADVILANPPFMSPKGGIRPHNRFSVKSKRSEVLFVDYMAEHLTPSGRAGIIVPEGIIFQSQNAHKQLRKMLVEDYLVAVVSLPAGVFNPYSGVKTSILILDKALAKRTDHIAFFKVENDGFDLGAQRRPIDQNDLPNTQEAVKEYMGNVGNMDGQDGQDKSEPPPSPDESILEQLIQQGTALVVKKGKIAEGGEYNLSGERYRIETSFRSEWPSVKVGGLFEKADESVMPDTLVGPINYIGLEHISQSSGHIDGDVNLDNPRKIKSLKNVFQPGDILYGKLRPNLNKVWLSDRSGICSTDIFVLRPIDKVGVLPALYARVFRSSLFNRIVMSQIKGAQLPRIGWQSFANIEVPLPPLDVQREIVEEIEGYQRVIDGARAVIDNYRPHIPIDPEWPMVELGEIVDVRGGKRLPKGQQFTESPSDHPYIRVSDFQEQSVRIDDLRFISEEVHRHIARYTISSADVYISIAGTIGLMGTIPDELDGANLTENAAKLSFDENQLDKRFLAFIGSGELIQDQIRSLTHAVGVPKLALERIRTLRIPVPHVDRQKAIVAEIKAEKSAVDANRNLITRFEKKIHAAVGRVWGEAEQG